VKYGFPLAEKQKRWETFFSHAAQSMGSSAWGVSGHVRVGLAWLPAVCEN